MAEIRLYVSGPLETNRVLPLDTAQSAYLFGVMRRKLGDELRVFDGKSGEWRAEVAKANKRNGLLLCVEPVLPQATPPDLWLLFAPIKKARTAFVVEKAVEMGVQKVLPVTTDFTNERINIGRMQAHAIEAAEQCGATFVPDVAEPVRLLDMLESWPENRKLVFCDERREALPVATALARETAGAWAIVIGPEGGFSPEEVAALRGRDAVVSVSLGPRILRADTAAVAAITAWQMALGDWR